MKGFSMSKYLCVLATAIVVVLMAVVFITRNNKSVAGLKQVFKAVEINEQLP